MLIGGTLNVMKPGLKKQEVFLNDEKHAIEFEINFDESKKEEADFNVWFKLDESDVTIMADDDAEENGVYDTVFLRVATGDNKHCALLINTDQARAIKEILDHYLSAWESFRHLKKELKVPARVNST